jgi:HAD superfamily hydrolase (TIGR01490 family)
MNSFGKIGAFFDLDGTLIASPSLEWQFIGYLLARDAVGGGEILRWLAQCAKDCLRDPHAVILANKRYLSGLRASLADEWANSLAHGFPTFFPAGIECVAWHIAQGHRVFLVSGTLKPLADIVARRLPGQVEVCATELDVCNVTWTGRLAGEHMSGDAKARAIRRLAARFGLALWESYAYGDSVADLPMLDSVGHRVAVNPSPRLRRIARSEGWQSCNWTKPVVTAIDTRARRLAPKEAR